MLSSRARDLSCVARLKPCVSDLSRWIGFCLVPTAVWTALSSAGCVQAGALERKEMVEVPTFSWRAAGEEPKPWRPFPFTADRLAYVLMDRNVNSPSGSIQYQESEVVFDNRFALVGLPLRNQINRLEMAWGNSAVLIALRCTDAFGEILIDLRPAEGTATAYSNTINRIMKGGVSHSSPMPEETLVERIGRFQFAPAGEGGHRLTVSAVEQQVRVSIDGQDAIAFEDPDVAGGSFGIGTPGTVSIYSFSQHEYVTPDEQKRRDDFVRKMHEFALELDAEYEADVERNNTLSIRGNTLTWTFPDTGAQVVLTAKQGSLTGTMNAGLYGNARLLSGNFAHAKIVAEDGEVYHPAPDAKPTLQGDATHLDVQLPLQSASGKTANMHVLAKFTENATWFWTAEIEGVSVATATLSFGLDSAFAPNREPTGLANSVLRTDAVVGHYWQRISGQDTRVAIREVDDSPTLVLQSKRPRFRWATMWLPMHKLILTGYKKRMLHFIRYPETPVQEWRERPSRDEYPTDEELRRYAAHGVEAMVWHHTWTSNNYRLREGFVVHEAEMRRAMRKAHDLGISVITYIGIVPGRHPVLRYEDLAGSYDKNWDLQDFTFYSVAGRWPDFLAYMTDYWCREYGLDGFYVDGGLAGLSWGNTGLCEEDVGGLSLEELNDRLYSRVKRVLRRHSAGFGLENWGGQAIQLAAPFYDCRMIGESFQEASPHTYRDSYNPLLTGTPFKMYGMNLKARNRYNVAMAAVCMTDIQLCSGNYAWGNWPDRPSDWANLKPFWSILESIEWDHLVDAKPWWAQELVEGEGFYAAYYLTPSRAVLFLASRTEEWSSASATIRKDLLPERLRRGRFRQVYPERGQYSALGEGTLQPHLPPLHYGPLGYEIVPVRSR